MKRSKLIIAALCAVSVMTGFAQQRSMHELDSIAHSVRISGKGARATVVPMRMSLTASQVLKTEAQAPLAPAAGESFYVYTPMSPADAGFVIVSGDKRLPGVLGYSDESHFDHDSLPDGLQWFLRKVQYDTELLAKQNSDSAQLCRMKQQKVMTAASAAPRTSSLPTSVAPLLGNRIWNQDTPFNNDCPKTSYFYRGYTGCVATAIAQIMAHHKYPAKGTGNISYTTESLKLDVSVDLDAAEPYRWDDMLDSYDGDYTEAQADAVSQLMFHVGAAVSMDYDTDGSGSNGYKSEFGLRNHFNYDDDIRFVKRDNYSYDEWHNILKSNLAAGCPIYYDGNDEEGTSGHAFVFDGYNEEDLYHVNWGWSGLCNGYYDIYALTPAELGIGAGYGDYSYDCGALVNVYPDNGVAETEPTNMNFYSIASDNGIGSFPISQEIALTMYYLTNSRYLTFNGEFQLMLKDEKGNLVAMMGEPLRAEDVVMASYCEELGISASLPDNLADGKYRLYVGVRQDGYTEWGKVRGWNYDTWGYDYYDVVVKGDEYSLGTGEEPTGWKLACQEFGVNSDYPENVGRGNYYITATVDYFPYIYNVGGSPFTGVVSLMLADENGANLRPFGEPVVIANLAVYDYYMATLYDALPDDFPDGKYRLYLGALGYTDEGPEGDWQIIEHVDSTKNSYMTLVVRDSHFRVGENYEEPAYGFRSSLTDKTELFVDGEDRTYRATLNVSNNFQKSLDFGCYLGIVNTEDEEWSTWTQIYESEKVSIASGKQYTEQIEVSLSDELPVGLYWMIYYLSEDDSWLWGDSGSLYHLLRIADPTDIEEASADASSGKMAVLQKENSVVLGTTVSLTGWDIISTLGTTVAQGREQVESGSTTTIDLGHCPAGIYSLRGHGADGKTYVVKFVKR